MQILYLAIFVGIIICIVTSTHLLDRTKKDGFQSGPSDPVLPTILKPTRLPLYAEPNSNIPGTLPYAPYSQTASVGSFPYQDPALLPAEFTQMKQLYEDLRSFLVFEGASISGSSDPTVQLPLTQLRADSNKLEQEVSVLSKNPGIQSSLTQQDLADIQEALTFLQRKVRLFQTAGVVSRGTVSRGTVSRGIEGFTDGSSILPYDNTKVYSIGDKVTLGDQAYVMIDGIGAAGYPPPRPTNWSVIQTPPYDNTKIYRIGDMVTLGDQAYIMIDGIGAAGYPPPRPNNWEPIPILTPPIPPSVSSTSPVTSNSDGSSILPYDNTKIYSIGDKVILGDQAYVMIDGIGAAGYPPPRPTNWSVIQTPPYDNTKIYRIGDMVTLGDQAYIMIDGIGAAGYPPPRPNNWEPIPILTSATPPSTSSDSPFISNSDDVTPPKTRATKQDLQDLQSRIYGSILILSSSATSDPVVQARVKMLQKMYSDISDMINKLDNGTWVSTDVPIYEEDISVILPNLSNPNAAVMDIFSQGNGKTLSPIEKQLAGLVGTENATNVFNSLLDKGMFRVNMELGYNVPGSKPVKYSKKMDIQPNSNRSGWAPSNSRTGASSTNNWSNTTSNFSTNAKADLTSMDTDTPYDSVMSGAETRADSTPTGLDWKSRATSICEQVRLRGLDPQDFGCIPTGSLMSPAYSWRGHTKMICGRLAATIDPGLPVTSGCPPPNWSGWSISQCGSTPPFLNNSSSARC